MIKENKIIPSIKLILHYNNEVLLLKENDGWDLPGGRMKYGESIFACLKRELQEELGVKVEFATEPRLIRVYDYLHPQDKVQRVYIVYAYQLDHKLEVNNPTAVWQPVDKLTGQNQYWLEMIVRAVNN